MILTTLDAFFLLSGVRTLLKLFMHSMVFHNNSLVLQNWSMMQNFARCNVGQKHDLLQSYHQKGLVFQVYICLSAYVKCSESHNCFTSLLYPLCCAESTKCDSKSVFPCSDGSLIICVFDNLFVSELFYLLVFFILNSQILSELAHRRNECMIDHA